MRLFCSVKETRSLRPIRNSTIRHFTLCWQKLSISLCLFLTPSQTKNSRTFLFSCILQDHLGIPQCSSNCLFSNFLVTVHQNRCTLLSILKKILRWVLYPASIYSSPCKSLQSASATLHSSFWFQGTLMVCTQNNVLDLLPFPKYLLELKNILSPFQSSTLAALYHLAM